MSAEEGSVRAVYRFAEWELVPTPDTPTRYRAECLVCQQGPGEMEDADAAQLWCLRHAGATRHSVFDLSATRNYDATMTDSAAEDTPPT